MSSRNTKRKNLDNVHTNNMVATVKHRHSSPAQKKAELKEEPRISEPARTLIDTPPNPIKAESLRPDDDSRITPCECDSSNHRGAWIHVLDSILRLLASGMTSSRLNVVAADELIARIVFGHFEDNLTNAPGILEIDAARRRLLDANLVEKDDLDWAIRQIRGRLMNRLRLWADELNRLDSKESAATGASTEDVQEPEESSSASDKQNSLSPGA